MGKEKEVPRGGESVRLPTGMGGVLQQRGVRRRAHGGTPNRGRRITAPKAEGVRAAGKLWRIRIRNSRDQPRGNSQHRSNQDESPPNGQGAQKRKGRSRACSGEGCGRFPGERRGGTRGAAPQPRLHPPRPSPPRGPFLGAPPGARRTARRCLWSPLGSSGLGSERPTALVSEAPASPSNERSAATQSRPPPTRLRAQARGWSGAAAPERRR